VGEAAKGILHVKNIEWAAVRLVYDSEPLKQWAVSAVVRSLCTTTNGHAPVGPKFCCFQSASFRTLACYRKTQQTEPLPSDWRHEICGEQGLAWSRRLQLIDAGLNNKGGFPERVCKYLGKKYGYSPQVSAQSGRRVADVLRMLASRLKQQRQAASGYYIGDALTAVDIYSATAMAMFAPLPPEQCRMDGPTRAAFGSRDPEIEAALDPILFQHRDMIFAESLQLPLSL
jgi:hypothetical protein